MSAADIIAKAADAVVQKDLSSLKSLFDREHLVRVTGVSRDATEAQCRAFFETFGRVINAHSTFNRPDVWTVEYADVNSATSAINTTQPQINGETVTLRPEYTSSRSILREFRDRFYFELRTCTIINFPFGIEDSPELTQFLTQFGTIEQYSILPYTPESSLITIRFHYPSSVRSAVDLFHTCTTRQTPLLFHQKPLKLYPGTFKPTIHQHKYDLCPPYQIIPASPGSSRIILKYRNEESPIDLERQAHQTAYLPYSYHFHLARQNAMTNYMQINTALYTSISLSNLWSPDRFTPGATDQAHSLLIDLMSHIEKIARVIYHKLHPTGILYLRVEYPYEAALIHEFFNSRPYNGGLIKSSLISLQELTQHNPDATIAPSHK